MLHSSESHMQLCVVTTTAPFHPSSNGVETEPPVGLSPCRCAPIVWSGVKTLLNCSPHMYEIQCLLIPFSHFVFLSTFPQCVGEENWVDSRTIYIGHKEPPPGSEAFIQQRFPDNRIVSSKVRESTHTALHEPLTTVLRLIEQK